LVGSDALNVLERLTMAFADLIKSLSFRYHAGTADAGTQSSDKQRGAIACKYSYKPV